MINFFTFWNFQSRSVLLVFVYLGFHSETCRTDQQTKLKLIEAAWFTEKSNILTNLLGKCLSSVNGCTVYWKPYYDTDV